MTASVGSLFPSLCHATRRHVPVLARELKWQESPPKLAHLGTHGLEISPIVSVDFCKVRKEKQHEGAEKQHK